MSEALLFKADANVGILDFLAGDIPNPQYKLLSFSLETCCELIFMSMQVELVADNISEWLLSLLYCHFYMTDSNNQRNKG